MPKRSRDNNKRLFAYAYQGLDKAAENTAMLWNMHKTIVEQRPKPESFGIVEPDYSLYDTHDKLKTLLDSLLQMLMMAQDVAQAYSRAVFGYFPDDLTSWSATGADSKRRKEENEDDTEL